MIGVDKSGRSGARRNIARSKRSCARCRYRADQCIAYAKRNQHPEFEDRAIWEVYQEERRSLMDLRGPFDRFVEKAARAPPPPA